MTEPPRVDVDWFRVITDIRRRGWTYESIADKLTEQGRRVSDGAVLGWAQGATPRHPDGECLISLWCVVMLKERAELPMRSQQCISSGN